MKVWEVQPNFWITSSSWWKSWNCWETYVQSWYCSGIAMHRISPGQNGLTVDNNTTHAGDCIGTNDRSAAHAGDCTGTFDGIDRWWSLLVTKIILPSLENSRVFSLNGDLQPMYCVKTNMVGLRLNEVIPGFPTIPRGLERKDGEFFWTKKNYLILSSFWTLFISWLKLLDGLMFEIRCNMLT